MILSQIEEVTSDLGEPDCKLTEPFLVTTSEQKITMQEGVMVLAPWLLGMTNQNTFMISSDKILTIVEPNAKMVKKYEELMERE
tara:strand:+ start:1791 stop:2042 length:252 start_codon:yes stop_codon:yes gene_type:complete